MDMGAAGTVALCHFIDKLGTDSALAHEISGHDTRDWSERLRTNSLLADLFDAVQLFQYGFAEKGSPKPKPYPRPWTEDKAEKYGKDPIPIREFNNWWSGQKED